MIDRVVAPVFQRYDEKPAGAVSVTLPPAQNVVGPEGVTVGAGSGLTVTATGVDCVEQKFASLTVTL